jgi:hypothetical protein
MHTSSSSSSLE